MLQLLLPFGKEISIDELYNRTTTTHSKFHNDDTLSRDEKKEVLKKRTVELQKKV